MSKARGKNYVENNFSPHNYCQVQQQWHYFNAKKNMQVLSCQFCKETFVRKNDLFIHLERTPLTNASCHGITGMIPCENLNMYMFLFQ